MSVWIKHESSCSNLALIGAFSPNGHGVFVYANGVTLLSHGRMSWPFGKDFDLSIPSVFIKRHPLPTGCSSFYLL